MGSTNNLTVGPHQKNSEVSLWEEWGKRVEFGIDVYFIICTYEIVKNKDILKSELVGKQFSWPFQRIWGGGVLV